VCGTPKDLLQMRRTRGQSGASTTSHLRERLPLHEARSSPWIHSQVYDTVGTVSNFTSKYVEAFRVFRLICRLVFLLNPPWSRCDTVVTYNRISPTWIETNKKTNKNALEMPFFRKRTLIFVARTFVFDVKTPRF
jgi:hypothetical protein